MPAARATRAALAHLLVLVLALAPVPASGYVGAPRTLSGQPQIEELEAALLVTIAKFVEWPSSAFPSPSSPLVIGVVSDALLAAALETTAHGREVNGRGVSLRRLQWDSDMVGVHLLFVGAPEGRRLAALLERVNGMEILTVSMLPEFARHGGMLTLQSTDGRLSFTINAQATDGSGLRLSSFLRAHATRVSIGSARVPAK